MECRGIEESKPKLSKPARHEGPRSTEESRGAPDRNTHGEDTHGPLISPPSSESTGDTDAPGGEEWHDVREEEDEEDVEERETGQEGETAWIGGDRDRAWSRSCCYLH